MKKGIIIISLLVFLVIGAFAYSNDKVDLSEMDFNKEHLLWFNFSGDEGNASYEGEYNSDEIYREYPELKDIKLEVTTKGDNKNLNIKNGDKFSIDYIVHCLDKKRCKEEDYYKTTEVIVSNLITKAQLREQQKQLEKDVEKYTKERDKTSTDINDEILHWDWLQDSTKDTVNKFLHSPSSAKYPGGFLDRFDGWQFSRKGNRLSLSSYVDSQNAFGATMRNYFKITFEYDFAKSKGKVVYLKLGDEVLINK